VHALYDSGAIFRLRFFDVLFQRRPAGETVFPREHELRVGERDGLLVRQLRAYACPRLGITGSERLQQLLRLVFLLLEVRTGRERTAVWR
jgi:hypothetical protein